MFFEYCYDLFFEATEEFSVSLGHASVERVHGMPMPLVSARGLPDEWCNSREIRVSGAVSFFCVCVCAVLRMFMLYGDVAAQDAYRAGVATRDIRVNVPAYVLDVVFRPVVVANWRRCLRVEATLAVYVAEGPRVSFSLLLDCDCREEASPAFVLLIPEHASDFAAHVRRVVRRGELVMITAVAFNFAVRTGVRFLITEGTVLFPLRDAGILRSARLGI
jgi:hypothetical protein